MNLRTRISLAVAGLAVIAGALLLGSGVGYATSGGSDPSIGTIRVAVPCTAAQAAANHGRGAVGEHDDAMYRCKETAPGCFQWKWQYDSRPKTGKSWSRPPCPACSPSPSKSASSPALPNAGPSGSVSAAGSPAPSGLTKTSPAADQLPVTGTSDVIGLIGAAFVLIGAGGLVLVGAHTIRRATG